MSGHKFQIITKAGPVSKEGRTRRETARSSQPGRFGSKTNNDPRLGRSAESRSARSREENSRRIAAGAADQQTDDPFRFAASGQSAGNSEPEGVLMRFRGVILMCAFVRVKK